MPTGREPPGPLYLDWIGDLPKIWQKKIGTVAGRAHIYKDKTTAAFMDHITLAARQAVSPYDPFDGPTSLSVVVFFPLTRSRRSTSKTENRPLDHVARQHHVKPDHDNVSKVVQDALTRGGWFTDDGRACESHVRKYWTLNKEGSVHCVARPVPLIHEWTTDHDDRSSRSRRILEWTPDNLRGL